MTAKNPRPRTMWVPVPALAVPVKVTFDTTSVLDPLARTLLRLLKVRGRNADQVAVQVGLPTDLVNSVLDELLDRGLVREESEVYVASRGADGREMSGEIHAGWAFLIPQAVPVIIPRLWLRKKPPSPNLADAGSRYLAATDFIEAVKGWHREERPTGPDDAALAKLLRRLTGNDELEVMPWPPEGGAKNPEHSDDQDDKLYLPDISSDEPRPVIASISIDEHTRASSRRFARVVLWSQVDFLPRIAEPAFTVFHEPELAPGKFGPRPISELVPTMLSTAPELRKVVAHVDEYAEAMRAEFSIVLKLVGLKDEEALEREVEAHRARLEEKTALCVPTDIDEWSEVTGKVRNAWRWAVIAKLEPERYLAIARDQYAHAVEALIQRLRDFSMPSLQSWSQSYADLSEAEQKRFRKVRQSADWFRDRSGMVGFGEDLGPSGKHVARSLERPQHLPAIIEEYTNLPAGSSLTLWLLPAYLLETEEAEEFARPIAGALDRNPFLLTALDELRELRNATFHNRGEAPMLELTDRSLFEVWGTLAAAYKSEVSNT